MPRSLPTVCLAGALLCALSTTALAQVPIPRQPPPAVKRPALSVKTPAAHRIDRQRVAALKLDQFKLSDFSKPQASSMSPSEKLAVLANLPQRYGIRKMITGSKQVVGQSSNGVQYFMSRNNPVLPGPTQGATTAQRGQDDLIVCQETPLTIAQQFAGPLMIAGLPASQNQSVIHPGALFRDSEVVRGIFTPLSLQRRPGSVTIDVFNLNGSVASDVQNFNDRTQVASAINSLRSGAAGAQSNAYLEYTEVAFRAKEQFNVEMESSMEANLEALLGIPASVGGGLGGSLGFEQSVNVAVAALNQVYYTISLGGEGPASTVDGTVPNDVLCVTDVQYGRRAFLMVGSFVSRTEASLVLSQLAAISGGGVDLVEANRTLSAEAKRALELGFVRVTVVGGNVQNAVQVRDLASLRNYVEQIDPSVAGANAVPIAYTLRYAADNAPAKVGAFAQLIDKECFRASQVKVTLSAIKPTKVVDWGDEELFGHVKIVDSGNLSTGSRTLWSKSQDNAVSGRQGVAISVNESATLNINAAVSSADEVKVELELNDRIMGPPDPEFAGAHSADRERGYAKYERKTPRVKLAEIRAAPGARLTRTFAVEEGEARVEFTLIYELLAP